MADGSTWLCPTPFDRERLLDMERRLARPRAVMYGALALAFLASIPWMGAWVLGLLAAPPLGYALLQRRVHRSARPEYAIAFSVVNAQVILGIGVAFSGGPDSPAIPILLLPIVTLPARFTSRGVIGGVAITIVVLLLSTVAVDPSGFADDPTHVFVGLATIAGLAAFAHVLMRSEVEQRAHAVLDPLTGLLNRKSLAARFGELAEQARQSEGSVCVIACDLDHFKEINDEHGHQVGDGVLKATAYVLRKSLRTFELAYRLGGEEFLVVLPGSSVAEGAVIAERMRAAVEAERPAGVRVTASFGVAAATGDGVDLEQLSAAADMALYDAKRAGRNRVVATDAAPGPQRRGRVLPAVS